MKKITLLLLLSIVITFSAGAGKYRNRNARITISIQTFYDQLSPYGDWIYTGDYGYVWRPYFDNPESFRPYSSNGNWVYTTYGWTWVSDYNWGWATFHYGRWNFDDYLGWLWIPGDEWAPAWVTWGSYNNYWGWAPMGPNIYAQNNSNWYAPDSWWTFVSFNQFCSSNWNSYIYTRPIHVTNITHITNIYVNRGKNNSWYNGPRVTDVEKYSKNKVRRVEITESQRPENTGVRNDRLSVYRPAVENSRRDSRPVEYRNAEQERKGRMIEQTNARVNDPGINRTRESRTGNSSSNQVSVQRNGSVSSTKRIETRNSVQVRNEGSGNTRRETTTIPRTTGQTTPRTTQVNSQSRVEPGNGAQVSTARNTSLPSADTKRETPIQQSNARINTGNSSSGGQVKATNQVSRQATNTATVRGNAGNNTTQVRSTQSAAPAGTRVTNTGNQAATTTEVKKNENSRSAAASETRATGKPKRK
jgi:hypothetical protein